MITEGLSWVSQRVKWLFAGLINVAYLNFWQVLDLGVVAAMVGFRLNASGLIAEILATLQPLAADWKKLVGALTQSERSQLVNSNHSATRGEFVFDVAK